jgi:membrane protease YdiL (CAAX protease family)
VELSNTRGIAPAPSNILLHVMRRHPLFFYFLIAYAVTWSVGFLLIVLLHRPPTLGVFLTMIAGPTISAFIMTAATEGKAGVSRLLRRCVLWRVGVPWYLLVLIATPVLLLLSILILPGGTAIVRSLVVNYPLSYLVTMFLGGPFFEEPGWRGFALPRLQQHIGPVRGSLLLGVLWTFWHLPVFFIPGFNGAGVGLGGISTAVLAFLIGTIAMTVIFTWVFNNTRGSLLLAILLHTSLDAATPPSGSLLLFSTLYVVIAVVALLIIVATRRRLSYERYVRETGLPTLEGVREQEPVAPGRSA